MPKIKVKRFKQESAHRQMDRHIHRRYQTYYLPCYAVDKNDELFRCFRHWLVFYMGPILFLSVCMQTQAGSFFVGDKISMLTTAVLDL